MKAIQIAEYFLTLCEPEAGDTLSNLKIQKLCYYAQGFHLAIFGKPLFEEPILAWTHGPVIESLYFTYKQYGSGSVPIPETYDFSVFSNEIKEMLNDVYTVYGQFSAWKLRNMTHEEAPWRNTPQSYEISHEDMKNYFKTMIVI